MNFNRAFAKLNEAIKLSDKESLSELEVEGLIQWFEYTCEFAWKTLQDLIKIKSFIGISGPGAVLNQAFELGLIDNPEGWRRLKKSRELASHTYDSETAKEIPKTLEQNMFFFLQSFRKSWRKSGQVKQVTYLSNEAWNRKFSLG